MNGAKRFSSALSLSLALLLGLIATAPLWHAPHDGRAESAVAKTHGHSVAHTALRGEGSSRAETGCPLCFTQRLLSMSLFGGAVVFVAPPPETDAHVELAVGIAPGKPVALSARAPPRC
jgi:hypothetical protein